MSTAAARLIPMTTKRTALIAFLKATLATYKEGYFKDSWRIDYELREALTKQVSRKARLQVMGDPIRYIHVFHQGPDFSAGPRGGNGIARRRGDRFFCQLWLQHDLGSGSQQLFDEAIADHLLNTLATVDYLDIDSDTGTGPSIHLSIPEEASTDLVALDNTGTDLAHYARFLVTIS